jgi:endonuclease YncB( thermonuclease family)
LVNSRASFLLVAFALLTGLAGSASGTSSPVYRIDHVVDGDTIALRNGQHVRLVQIAIYYGWSRRWASSRSA